MLNFVRLDATLELTKPLRRGALIGGLGMLGRLGGSGLAVLHDALQRGRGGHLLVRALRTLLHLHAHELHFSLHHAGGPESRVKGRV